LLAKKSGLKIDYVSGPSWKEFVELTKKKEIDVLLNTAFNKERTEWLDFADKKYFSVHYGIAVNSESHDINEFKDILNKTVAVEDGFWMQKWLQENHPEVKIKAYKDTLEALTAVSLNDADAYLGNISVGGYLITKHWLTNVTVKPLGRTKLKKSNGLFIGISKGNRILKSIIDKTMAAVTDEEVNRLVSKWSLGSSSSVQEAPLSLTVKERAYLHYTREPIKMCVDPDWMPFERINDAGMHEGMTADLMGDVGRKLGVDFKLVPTKSWSETLQFVREGRCSLISAAAETAPRREYLSFTTPHGEYPLVVAVRGEELFIENLAAISDKTLGVVKGYAHIALIREKYPNLAIVEVANVSDGLKRVQDGEIFGFIDTVPTIGYTIRRQGITDLKIGGKLDIPLKLSIAVGKGEPLELVGVLNKALASISNEEKRIMADKWFTIKIEKVFDYTHLWQILAGVFFLFLIFFYWNRKLTALNRELKVTHDKAEDANRAKGELLKELNIENSERRLSEELLRSIIESSKDGILVVNNLQETTHTNTRFSEMWHIPKELLDTRDDEKLLRHVTDQLDDPEAFLSKVNDLYSSKEKSLDIIDFKDGRIFERYSLPLIEDGKVTGRVWSFEDITQRKHSEEEIKQAKEAAELANQAKSTFLATMSHEIRTPLNPIIGLTHLALQAAPSDRVRGYLNKIQASSKSLLRLINDILDFSKIEAGKIVVEVEPFSLGQVMENLKSLYGIKAHEKQLGFSVSVSPETPGGLVGDPLRLEQVLSNLISNAIKFTKQGSVSIDVEPTKVTGEIALLEFSVRDTGIGIDEEKLSEVFQAFTQADDSTTRKYGGTGLGLSICQKLISLMGSELK
ncbi:MAG: transporter substrate-binding domain-containing protein, partial [Anaerolineales bacterium]